MVWQQAKKIVKKKQLKHHIDGYQYLGAWSTKEQAHFPFPLHRTEDTCSRSGIQPTDSLRQCFSVLTH
jgi:hypothetical protein